MISRNMIINAVFIVINIFIFFVLAKLLLICAELGLVIDKQTNTVTTVFFLAGGLLCSLYVIHKNRASK